MVTSHYKTDTLIDLARNLCLQNEFEDILRITSQTLSGLVKAEKTLIMMINPQTLETLKTIFRDGETTEDDDYHVLHVSISGWVIKHKEALISEDIRSDPRFRKGVFADVKIKSVLCIPLRCESVLFGTISVFRDNHTNSFTADDLNHMEQAAVVVSPFLRNVQKIENYFQPQIPKETILLKYREHGLLGKSQRFIDLLRTIDAAAKSDTRVLLQGKSGTGKELVAKAIHNFSKRNTQKFIAIDCGAVPEHLIESELFGHVKGAFTGASGSRTGLFEEANKGTLFMDEISNLPLELQAKLLRVLQEGEIRPLGSNTTRKIDVRIISASSESLRGLVDQHQFREDLFYRLMVYPVNMPMLEERREDIPLLANHFLKQFAKEQNKKATSFHEEIIDFMKHHPWTGNIRELENFIERMVTLTPQNSKRINSDLLPSEYRTELKNLRISKKQDEKRKPLIEIVSDQEKQLLKQTLIDHQWNQSAAAKVLGIHESTLRYKIQKYNIKRLR